jgi:hypothetical protein
MDRLAIANPDFLGCCTTNGRVGGEGGGHDVRTPSVPGYEVVGVLGRAGKLFPHQFPPFFKVT